MKQLIKNSKPLETKTAFQKELYLHVSSGNPFLWVNTASVATTREEMIAMFNDPSIDSTVVHWNVNHGDKGPAEIIMEATNVDPDPENRYTVYILENFHWFMDEHSVMQAILDRVYDCQAKRVVFVVLSSVLKVPEELTKFVTVLEYPYPDIAKIRHIADEMEFVDGYTDEAIEAASGLTPWEIQNTLAPSKAKTGGKMDQKIIWDYKASAFKKDGLLSVYKPGKFDTLDQLGGLENMKNYHLSLLRQHERTIDGEALIKPMGTCLLGVWGCGKSAFTKALGAAVQRPVVILDVGNMMGGLVGQTESNIRSALKQIDAMGRCIVMIDEVDKALSGVGGSGANDSGVTARLFGTLLTWMQDKKSDSFIICTCNDVSKIPPEFLRAERFDAVFFIDTPGVSQRHAIWNIHLRNFGIEKPDQFPDDHQWTGAEIRTCCRQARMHDLSINEAAKYVVPIASTAKEKLKALRMWASDRCLDAEQPRVYVYRH